MKVFDNDPFQFVAEVVQEMFPDMPWPLCQWCSDIDALGDVLIPDDGTLPIVVTINASLSVNNAIEIFAHELAHVACEHLGLPHPSNQEDHLADESGQYWAKIFDEICYKYEERVSQYAEEP